MTTPLLAALPLVTGILNRGGVPYKISNPADDGGPPYSTDFEENVQGRVEHFDVYGTVQTRYSQVYWTRNAPIDLPPELVKRFDGKVMAITGYEVDQVTHKGPHPPPSPAPPGVLSGFACYPECNGTDASVPIYNAYNHHYFGWLLGKDAEIYERKTPLFAPNPTRTGVRSVPGADVSNGGYPTNIVFKENPGGEFRKSYHGYPSGYAQLLHSPSTWVVEPMQIDTHNRAYGLTEPVGLQPSFLPQRDHNNMTDFTSGLSPLIECPCSDRITRGVVTTPMLRTDHATCSADGHTPIPNATACAAAVAAFAPLHKLREIHDASRPAGCMVEPAATANVDSATDGRSQHTYDAVFNTLETSTVDCASGGNAGLFGTAGLGGLTNLTLAHDGTTVRLTLSGPSDVWFAVGFNASAMADEPYTIVVDGHGDVSERVLANHGPGEALPPSLTLVHSSVDHGVRTVVLTRKLAIAAHADVDDAPAPPPFPISPMRLSAITAVGHAATFGRHKAHAQGDLMLLPAAGGAAEYGATTPAACVCEPKREGFLEYMDLKSTHTRFDGYTCADEPRSDMLRHGDGTGRNVPNAACSNPTYHGGLYCCKHGYFLTDRADDARIPPAVDTYYLKWRYYFQEYTPPTAARHAAGADAAAVTERAAGAERAASHKHLNHWVFLIDQAINDYEEDNAHYGTASVGKITAHLRAGEMPLLGGAQDAAASHNGRFRWMEPLVMTPHCHAPSCIREELWNADSGELLCRVHAEYGHVKYGPTSGVFNEKGYTAIPPCLWGAQPGLRTPPRLSNETRLTAVKVFNNTYRHLGQMAQWTGLAVYDGDPY